MKAFHIVDRTIMLRDHQGDMFQFMLVREAEFCRLRLACPPVWKDGITPHNAATRIDMALISARDIARHNGMLS